MSYNPLYIIAGNYREAVDYAFDNRLGPHSYVYVSYVYKDSYVRLKEQRNIRYVTIGTWRNRPDCDSLIKELKMINGKDNTTISHECIIPMEMFELD